MFLESHFGEVHMNVPEPEKGHEDSQDEGAPEPVLLIRLDEADALVQLRSMVSYCFLGFLPFFLPRPWVEGKAGISSRGIAVGFIELMGVVLLIAGILPTLPFHSRPSLAPTKRFENVSRA
jgi:hypothetical protein